MQELVKEFRMRHTKTVWYEGISEVDRLSVKPALPHVEWIFSHGRNKPNSCDLVIISPWTKGPEAQALAIAALKGCGILIYTHLGKDVPINTQQAARAFGKQRLALLAQRNLGLLTATIYYLRDDFDMALASKHLSCAMQEMMDDDEVLARSWGQKVRLLSGAAV
jgi:hypothetical protein